MATINGLFVPTTDVFGGLNPEDIATSKDEMKNFLTRLRQNMNVLSIAMNLKDTGYYVTQQILNSQKWFPNPALNSTTAVIPTFRDVFRTVIDFGVLPNTGAKSVAHGINITPTTTFTRIYATASDPAGTFLPIPYAAPILTENIKMFVNGTNVVIETGSNRSLFTTTYAILEWIVN